jgi:hypothetical protein
VEKISDRSYKISGGKMIINQKTNIEERGK